jgi:hypothetical protein
VQISLLLREQKKALGSGWPTLLALALKITPRSASHVLVPLTGHLIDEAVFISRLIAAATF